MRYFFSGGNVRLGDRALERAEEDADRPDTREKRGLSSPFYPGFRIFATHQRGTKWLGLRLIITVPTHQTTKGPPVPPEERETFRREHGFSKSILSPSHSRSRAPANSQTKGVERKVAFRRRRSMGIRVESPQAERILSAHIYVCSPRGKWRTRRRMFAFASTGAAR